MKNKLKNKRNNVNNNNSYCYYLPVVLVVAGVMPIDRLAKERKIVFQRKREVSGEAAHRKSNTGELAESLGARKTKSLYKNCLLYTSRCV